MIRFFHSSYVSHPTFFDLRGLRYHYVDQGQGDPVVLVHGNPTWSFAFRSLIDALKTDHRVIAPDHIGCGLSEKPPDERYEYRLKQRVDDLEALLEHLGVRERITLVLHDWGGMIGMAYASRHPERIKRLVILNTAAFRLPAGKKLPWQIWIIRNTFLGPLLVRGLNLFSEGLVRWCVTRRLTPDERAGYLGPYGSWRDRIAVLRFIQDIPLSERDPSYEIVKQTEESLPRFADVPMLICWGARDFVFDDAFLRGWQERFPRAEVHRFEKAHHLVLEDEGPIVVELVKDFFRRHPLS
jgi:cis-3-alkyl-4-acyloxetan-2-one decarboxylase